MAFSNYSNLFTCGLLSEGTSLSYATAPWAAEYFGPRRGSLPSIDAFSEISDFSAQPLPPPASSGVSESTATTSHDGSLYFTFKKKRNPAEHRSFLSLDLAESQSLRSVSTKGKDKAADASSRGQQTESSVFSPTFSHSYVLQPFSSLCSRVQLTAIALRRCSRRLHHCLPQAVRDQRTAFQTQLSRLLWALPHLDRDGRRPSYSLLLLGAAATPSPRPQLLQFIPRFKENYHLCDLRTRLHRPSILMLLGSTLCRKSQ